jgi:hypothetical protein
MAQTIKQRIALEGAQEIIDLIEAITGKTKELGEASKGLEKDFSGAGFDTLKKQIDAATKGNTNARDAFKGLGVAIADATGKARPFNDIARDTAAAFRAMPEGLDQATLGLRLFGGEAANVLNVLSATPVTAATAGTGLEAIAVSATGAATAIASIGVAIGGIAAFTGIIALGKALFDLAKGSAEAADRIKKVSDSAQVSTGEVQRFRAVAKAAGLSVEEADSLLQRMRTTQAQLARDLKSQLGAELERTDGAVRSLGKSNKDAAASFSEPTVAVRRFGEAEKKAATEGKGFEELLRRLNIPAKEFEKLDLPAQLTRIQDALNKIPAGNEKLLIQQEVFKQYPELQKMFEQTAKSREDADKRHAASARAFTEAEEARSLALKESLDKAKAESTGLGDAIQATFDKIGSAISPQVKTAIDAQSGALRGLADAVDKARPSIVSFFEEWNRALTELDSGKAIPSRLGSIGDEISKFDWSGKWDSFKKAATDAYASVVESARKLGADVGAAIEAGFKNSLDFIKSEWNAWVEDLKTIARTVADLFKTPEQGPAQGSDPALGGGFGVPLLGSQRPGFSADGFRMSELVEDRRGENPFLPMEEQARSTSEVIAEIFRAMFADIKPVIVWDELVASAERVVAQITETFTAGVQTATAAFSNADWSGLERGPAEAATNILTTFQEMVARITELFGSGLPNAVQSAMSGIEGVVANMVANVSAQLDELAQKIKEVAEAAANVGGGDEFDFSGPIDGEGFARGGPVRGPGSGKSDSILAWLSNGEFVLKADAVRKWGVGFLQALNQGRMPRFAAGGHVSLPKFAGLPRFAAGGLASLPSLGGNTAGMVPAQINLPGGGGSFPVMAQPDVLASLARAATSQKLTRAGRRASWET